MPLLEKIGVPRDVKTVRAACAIKLLSNLIGMANMAVLAEGLRIGRMAGMEFCQMLELLQDTGARSYQMDLRGPWIAAGDYEPCFRVELTIKDMVLGCRMARELGFEPTLLQQGVIDGQENPHTINRDQKFWEVQKYITESHYLFWVGPLLCSEKWYRKLDDQTKALVNKAAKEAIAYEWAWADEQDAVAMQDCLDHGMVYDKLTDEPKWMEAARSVWPQFYDKVGGKELIDEALAIIGK